MIRLHDLVAVNPINIVYIEKLRDHVFIRLWNGKGHRIELTNGASAWQTFERLVHEIEQDVPLLKLRSGLVVNPDAICSIGKTAVGIAINLVAGSNAAELPVVYVPVNPNLRETEFTRIMDAIKGVS